MKPSPRKDNRHSVPLPRLQSHTNGPSGPSQNSSSSSNTHKASRGDVAARHGQYMWVLYFLPLLINSRSRGIWLTPESSVKSTRSQVINPQTPPARITSHHVKTNVVGPSNRTMTHGALTRRQDDWTTWDEVRVKVYGLTPVITTQDLWQAFSGKGFLFKIELFEDSRGARDGKAQLWFRPPPRESFWQADKYPMYSRQTGRLFVGLSLERGERKLTVPSPISSAVHYPQNMILNAESLDFGIVYSPSKMLGLHHITGRSNEQQLRLHLFRKEVCIDFRQEISDDSNNKTVRRKEVFRLSIPLSELKNIYRTDAGDSRAALVINLPHPPRYFRKIAESESHEEGSRLWFEDDAWYRQTDIVDNPVKLRYRPTSLRKLNPIIDLSQWTTYRLKFDTNNVNAGLVEKMGRALQDFNVKVEDLPNFDFIFEPKNVGWDFIDRPSQNGAGHVLEELMGESVPPLAFPVRYQLEVCISHGLLNQYNLSKGFATRLRAMDKINAQDILESIATQNKRIYEPENIFSTEVTSGIAFRRNIPSHCTYMRSATVTPTTVYFHTPSVEISNRVIRQFAEHCDRFLRVRFTDEKYRGGIYPTPKDTMNEVFTRIKRTMTNGINLGDRHYEFLAFGNSQFRQHGAYFFAPLHNLSCNQIRNWMGMFRNITEIAKFSARIGQCLSTTRAIHGTRVKIVEILDTERNGYNFTDGIGKISPFIARVAATELGFTSAEPPSAFQFRLGGCKGVLAVAPDIGFRDIVIRKSQYKFPAKHEGLEIIRCSQFIATRLNRQLILVLSALGVPDKIFIRKLQEQLSNLERAMTDSKIALAMLQKYIDHNQMSLALAGMIVDGFQRTSEPFIMSLLRLWRAWSIKYLKEKAQIAIDQGALLLGCVDETETLQGHFDSQGAPESRSSLPQIFVQVCRDANDKPQVMIGPMLLARNPSLHPGDIRVVQGIDVPALHHLKNVVVLPQTGVRDIANMCSGGDLDGDDFLVMWDQDLLPREWNHPPMDYQAPEPLRKSGGNVNMDDITSFFVNYMKNDKLPSIALAHVAWADETFDGVKSEKCLRLAQLHSKAVDYFKTGQAAVMPRDLRPKRWPHFMEKQRDNDYISRKILGKLYDQVERVDFQPALDMPFDERVLNAYALDPELLQRASDLKKHYDAALLRIMAQHDIQTEFEVWSTFVLHHSSEHKDFKFHEVIGELSATLKDQYRQSCYKAAGSKDYTDMGPFVAAMYTLTAKEVAEYQEREEKEKEKRDPPLISFPWLFQSVLGKIATGSLREAKNPGAAYIERIQGSKKTMEKPKDVKPTILSEDTLEMAKGEVTQRGEELKMFGDLISFDRDENEDDKSNQGAGVTPSTTTGSKSTSSIAPATVDELLGLDDLNSPLPLESSFARLSGPQDAVTPRSSSHTSVGGVNDQIESLLLSDPSSDSLPDAERQTINENQYNTAAPAANTSEQKDEENMEEMQGNETPFRGARSDDDQQEQEEEEITILPSDLPKQPWTEQLNNYMDEK